MDQNSEVLNRAINESLKKVDRSRRRRGAVILVLGILACLFTYALPRLGELKGNVLAPFRMVEYLGIACMVYGSALLMLGSKARMLYLKYFGNGQRGVIVFYMLLLGLAISLDVLARICIGLIIGP